MTRRAWVIGWVALAACLTPRAGPGVQAKRLPGGDCGWIITRHAGGCTVDTALETRGELPDKDAEGYHLLATDRGEYTAELNCGETRSLCGAEVRCACGP